MRGVATTPVPEVPIIYVVSDSIGETAELVARAALSQFDPGTMAIRRIAYATEESDIHAVLKEARPGKAVIAYTLISPGLRDLVKAETAKKGIPAVDILGPMMDAIMLLTDLCPRLQPGLIHRLDEDYFRRVEAVEFAVKYDDGKNPAGLKHADVVIIGVSRTSKTPVCMYLAQKRIKAANVPLVPELSPPPELMALPHSKVVGLTIDARQLNEIRRERLRIIGLDPNADYASSQRINRELEYARGIMTELGCPVIDVTNKAVEETVNRVLEVTNRRETRA
ncbi:MAG: pyruvate, water dikinase regulatory protein [Bacillota bacterium]